MWKTWLDAQDNQDGSEVLGPITLHTLGVPTGVSKSKGDGGCFENLQMRPSPQPEVCREQHKVFALAEKGSDEESPPCSGGTVLSFAKLFLSATSMLSLAQTLLKSCSKCSGWLYALVTRLLASEEIPTFVRKNVNNCCSQKSCFIQHPGKGGGKKGKKKTPTLRPLLHSRFLLSTIPL